MLCRLESVVFLLAKLERVRTERKREVGGKGSRTAKFDVVERKGRNVACSKEESVRLSNACMYARIVRASVYVRTNVHPSAYICKHMRACLCARGRT